MHAAAKAPVRYDDEVIVRTHLKYIRESLVQFEYELVRADDRTLLAEGDTTHIVVDREMKKIPLLEKYVSAFRAAMGTDD